MPKRGLEQLPPLPILGDLTPPSDRACFDQLPGTSLFPVSWEEYILPHPLPDPQTATVLQIYIQSDGSMGAMFDPANAEKPVKLGYSEYLGQTPPTGITWLDEGMWVSAGLASFENSAKFWLTFGEAIKNTETINFVIDGMDVFSNPERMRGDAVTHDEMDAIISGGYTPKLHLWQEGKELKGRERLQWIREWRKMRGL